MITGLALLIVFGLRLFMVFETLITTDKQLFCLLFGGMLVYCIGELMNSYMIQPLNSYQYRRKRALINNMIMAILLTGGVLLTLLIFMK